MPTTSFAITDQTKVAFPCRSVADATKLTLNSAGADMRFSFTGTELQINHSASGVAAIDVSIDGGAYTLVTTTSTATKTLVTLATGLVEGTHSVSIRLNAGYTSGGFKIWLADGIVVTGDAPAISAFPNHDTTGRQLLLHSDPRLVHNLADYSTGVAGYSSPPLPQTSSGGNRNGKIRFRTDGAYVWISSLGGGCRLYVDKAAVEEKNFVIPTGTSTPTVAWHSFALPNDGTMHEIMIVAPTIDYVMVSGGTGIFESSLAAGLRQCRVALIGDSITAGDSATPYTNSSSGFDALLELAFDGRCTFYNRGISGESVTTYLAAGKARTTLAPVNPDIVFSFMGVNDLPAMSSDAARDAKSLEYVDYYSEILRMCPKAIVRQLQPNLIHGGANINRTRLSDAMQTAIATVAANFPNRSIAYVAADPAWTYGVKTPAAGATLNGDHPMPSGNNLGLGMNHASIVLSAQPTSNDSITLTVGGTAYTFTFDGLPNSVAIGATTADTITNLWTTMIAVLGRANMTSWTKNSASEGHYVGVRNCTAIAKSGANIYVYRNTSPGLADMISNLIPAAPSTSSGWGFRRIARILGV